MPLGRKYTDQVLDREVIATIVRAGQQAPFAFQACSLVLTRKGMLPWGAPLMFTVCLDLHRFECTMARRGWKMKASDLSVLLFGLQDASLMAENMVIAAESLGLGNCFVGAAMYMADRFQKKYKLSERVYPFVNLVMGYLAQDYYRHLKGRRETFTYDHYSWTEYISRKLGQWNADPKALLELLVKCRFRITRKRR